MPISNLTNVPHAFMKLGKIRKGEKQTVKRKDGSTFEKPVDLDYFRVTFQPGKGSDEIEKTFRAAYGDRPTELHIRFAEPKIESVWDANYECYKQGGLVAQAGSNDNGLYWIFYRDMETSEVLVRGGSPVNAEGRAMMDKPIDLSQPIYKNAKGEGVYLEPVGRLQVVIPEIAHLAVGFFEFCPGSPRDIRNISAELGVYDAIAKGYGKSITGIPFTLIRREEEVTKKIDGKLTKGKSWPVHIVAGGEWGTKAIEMIERLALPDVVEGEVTEVSDSGPEWDAGFDEPPAPQLPAQTPIPAPPAEPKNDLPSSREALMKIFAKEFNQAVMAGANSDTLPKINPKLSPEEIKERIYSLRAAIAASK